jgi:hypothetical protein
MTWPASARTCLPPGRSRTPTATPAADNVAWFDGTAWHPVGSSGAGNGPWIGEGSALAFGDRLLYAAGNFTSAGGDTQAQSAASFSLTQIIAYPTPTVTPAPTSTPAVDITAPITVLRGTRLDQPKRRETFRFGAREKGSRFACKIDRKHYKPCTSPKTYRRLKPGRHVFRVKARDTAGNVDPTPVVKRFRIKRR